MTDGIGTVGAGEVRTWGRETIEARRRKRRLAPGAISLCLIMVFATWFTVSAPVMRAASGPSPDCAVCPGAPGYCIPNCPGEGTAPIISNVRVSNRTVDGITQVVWVNWSWTNGTGNPSPKAYPGFNWSTAGGVNQPIPASFKQGSIDLNALSAGSTYGFTISESNSYGTTTHGGQFTTLKAPTKEFVGFVSQMVSNPLLLDQVGPPLSSAHVWIETECPWVEINNNLYNPGWVTFPSSTTYSSGNYSLGFPEVYSYKDPLGVQLTYTLGSNGVCTFTDSLYDHYIYSNSHYFLYAGDSGYWNAMDWVSSTLSTSNDYQQFGLPQNNYTVGALGIAFSHTPYAGCSVGITNTATQQVQNYVNIVGYQTGYTATGWVNSSTTASAKYNGEASITADYHTTGTVNESVGNFSYGEVQAYGAGYDIATDTVTFNESDPSAPPIGNTSTNTTFERTVGPDSTQWVNSSNGGTYTSSSGLNLQVAISGGWYGASIGTNIGLVALTSAGSDTSHMVDCALNDPNSTYAYQFIITLDGTQWASSQAINAHIWFKDECIPVPKTGCP